MPLTERIFARLPGPGWHWMLVWGSLVLWRPLIDYVVLWALGLSERTQGSLERNVPTNVVLAYVAGLLLFGTRLLWRGATELQPLLRQIAPGTPPDAATVRRIGSISGPLVVALGVAAIGRGEDVGTVPAMATVIDFFLLLLIVVPVATWAWTYGVLLLAADRLGRHTLTLQRFPEDPGLGLRPVLAPSRTAGSGSSLQRSFRTCSLRPSPRPRSRSASASLRSSSSRSSSRSRVSIAR